MPTKTDTGLLHGLDLDALRTKLQRDAFREAFDDLVASVHRIAEADRQSDVIEPGGWCHSQYFTPAVLEAGFVHAITGDDVAAAHVARQIDKLARVYEDPPESFYKQIKGFRGKPSAYFSNAHTCLAARMCGDGLPGKAYTRLCDITRRRLIDDHHDPVYFFTHFNAGHNAVTTHVIAGAICALTFGHEVGHPDTDRIIEFGRDACENHVYWAYDEQGTPQEGPMYAQVTLEWVFLYADLLRRHGIEDLFETLPKLRAIAQATCDMQLPGTIGYCGFEDSRELITQLPMQWLLLTDQRYDRPQDRALWWDVREQPMPEGHKALHRGGWRSVLEMLWWDGEVPEQRAADHQRATAFVGQGAAVAVLRSSWSADAVCAYVHGQGRSRQVPDHTHADAGHFSIFAHGDYLAYDTAYFNFDEDTHSVVLIDDTPRNNTSQGNLYHGRFTRTLHHPMLDCIEIDQTPARGCMWADRIVLFVRGEGDFAYLVITDNINVDNQVHDYTWQLQANLHCRVDVAGDRTADIIGDRARLECTFFSPPPDDYPTSPHSLAVQADHHPHRNVWSGEPETNPRLVARQHGPNCSLMSIIAPRHLTDPRVHVTDATAYRTFNAYVEHGQYIDQIAYAPDSIYVRLPDLKASSPLTVVRRDREGRTIARWSIDDAAS